MSENTPKQSEAIRKAVEVLRPHWDEINQQAEHDIREYELLLQKDTSLSWRIIKCHLISEIYLDRYLVNKFPSLNIRKANLRYYQKVMLLPDREEISALFGPGLLALNTLRNKFSHNLDSSFSKDDISAMNNMLIISRQPVSTMTAIEMVEKFTAIACAFLNPTPSKIAELYAEAMRHVVAEHSSN